MARTIRPAAATPRMRARTAPVGENALVQRMIIDRAPAAAARSTKISGLRQRRGSETRNRSKRPSRNLAARTIMGRVI